MLTKEDSITVNAISTLEELKQMGGFKNWAKFTKFLDVNYATFYNMFHSSRGFSLEWMVKIASKCNVSFLVFLLDPTIPLEKNLRDLYMIKAQFVTNQIEETTVENSAEPITNP